MPGGRTNEQRTPVTLTCIGGQKLRSTIARPACNRWDLLEDRG